MRGGGIMWKAEDLFFYAKKASVYGSEASATAF
jgi:hypothetical protein